ncbi:hypothetical protein HYV84_06185 [Candidatus Woesearchaeota archaeon]|nr:hypothetical protein [Candidatus Woesearchaeota archaeon]
MREIVGTKRKELFESLGTMYLSLRGKEKAAALDAILDQLSKNNGDYPDGSSLLEVPLVADTAGENLSYRQIREMTGSGTVFLIRESDVDGYKKDPSGYTQPTHAPLITDDRRIKNIFGKRNGVKYLTQLQNPKGEGKTDEQGTDRYKPDYVVKTDEARRLVLELEALLEHMPSVKGYLTAWGRKKPVFEVVKPPHYVESLLTFDPDVGKLSIDNRKLKPWLGKGCAGRIAIELAEWLTRREGRDYFPEARKGIITFYTEREDGNR